MEIAFSYRTTSSLDLVCSLPAVHTVVALLVYCPAVLMNFQWGQQWDGWGVGLPKPTGCDVMKYKKKGFVPTNPSTSTLHLLLSTSNFYGYYCCSG